MGDANKAGDAVNRGNSVGGYSANRGTVVRTATGTTAKRVSAKVRSDPDDGSSSSSEDDDPAIAAMKENIMRYVPRSPPANPTHSRPKGTPPTGTKPGSVPASDKNPAAASSQKPAAPRAR